MTYPDARRTGVTLIELIVALAVLGAITTVVTVAIHRADPIPRQDPSLARAHAARTEAIATGRPQTFVIVSAKHVIHGTAFPDGSVVADDVLHIDLLTGVPRAARH